MQCMRKGRLLPLLYCKYGAFNAYSPVSGPVSLNMIK